MDEKVELERRFLAEAKAGKRIRPVTSIREAETPGSAFCAHHWRTIICVDDEDVCECSRCGRQVVTACNFDDDFA